MNLSDDLTPTSDPAPLLRVVRRRQRMRRVTRVFVLTTAVVILGLVIWPRPLLRQNTVAIVPPPAAPTAPSVTMTREEFIDSLKGETFALIQWPDGREQLLIRR